MSHCMRSGTRRHRPAILQHQLRAGEISGFCVCHLLFKMFIRSFARIYRCKNWGTLLLNPIPCQVMENNDKMRTAINWTVAILRQIKSVGVTIGWKYDPSCAWVAGRCLLSSALLQSSFLSPAPRHAFSPEFQCLQKHLAGAMISNEDNSWDKLCTIILCPIMNIFLH